MKENDWKERDNGTTTKRDKEIGGNQMHYSLKNRERERERERGSMAAAVAADAAVPSTKSTPTRPPSSSSWSSAAFSSSVIAKLVFFSCLFLFSFPSCHGSRLPPAKGKGPGGSIRQSLCNSWRFNVEVNNLRGWSVVPGTCEDYVAAYMSGPGYRDDSQLAVDQALAYAQDYANSSSFSFGSAFVWVFDIDETSLSNLPYYALHNFGAEAYNSTTFNAWVEAAAAPALPASLQLFNDLRDMGYLVFFLTGRSEDQRNVTVLNLTSAGYKGWEGLILRQVEDSDSTAVSYKSLKREALEKLGYTIVGNIGDQWSDLTGYSVGNRVFKLPNPMYFIS